MKLFLLGVGFSIIVLILAVKVLQIKYLNAKNKYAENLLDIILDSISKGD